MVEFADRTQPSLPRLRACPGLEKPG